MASAQKQPISPEHVVFGKTVRELRARRALTQEQLGLHSRLHRNYVGAIERGEINPTLRTMLRLEIGLNIPLAELFDIFEQRRKEGERR